jgi:hypothetical protein
MKVWTLARRAGLLAAALLLGAASPGTYGPLVAFDTMPPIVGGPPSAATHSAFSPAPVPDLEQSSGGWRKAEPSRVQLTPSFFHQREGVSGDGYTPNSTVFTEQTKRLRPTPGLNLNVPLQ